MTARHTPAWPAYLVAAVLALITTASAASSAQAQDVTATGILTAIWGDPHPSSSATPALRWSLTDDRGQVVDVTISDDVLRRAGSTTALNLRRVRVRGVTERRPDRRSGRPSLLRATGLRVEEESPTGRLHAPPQVGNRPYAVLLCRFADLPATPRPPSFFEALMGDDYPNMGHFYRQASGGRLDLAGSRAFGWFTLPRAHGEYFDSDSGVLLIYRLADDCIAAAASLVDFTAFSGIILQLNGQLSRNGQGMAWGGSRVLALDGPARVWPFLWMPLWAMEESRYGIYAHELGHSLGLPHSSGPYPTSYASNWDVMSQPYLRWDAGHSAWIPGGTIAFHKDLMGWIPEERRVTVSDTAELRIRLEPHTTGPGDAAGFRDSTGSTGHDPLLVRIPIPGTPDFYTVEARRRAGYDQPVPGSAVLFHRVPDPDGPGCTLHRCAEVVDGHGDGDPNGAGAMWMPGETFDDGVVRVTVIGATDTGWDLTVRVRAPPAPATLTVARAADALFRAAALSAEELEYLDTLGNRNGRYDLGDFLAFVRRQDR
jgi:M6 family metalloprotease-like protein